MKPRRQGKRVGKHRSKFEAKVVPVAELLGGEYEPFDIPYYIEETRRYRPDVVLDNGIVVEVKGFLTPEDRKKLRNIQFQYPYLDLRIVFQRGTPKIGPGSKTTFAMWAEQYGFKYAIGFIPDAWYHEPPNAQSLATIAKLREAHTTKRGA